MWVIFLLSAMAISLVCFVIAYIANKILIAMKKDLDKSENNKNGKEE